MGMVCISELLENMIKIQFIIIYNHGQNSKHHELLHEEQYFSRVPLSG